jgi:hypothetical protein
VGGWTEAEGSGAAAAAPTRENNAKRVKRIKGRLAKLCAQEAALDVVLCEKHAAKNKSAKRIKMKRKAVRAHIKAAESKLDTAVNAPVSGGRDPTEWLPDELLLMIFERLLFASLWSSACERVCLRWARLMESASIVHRKRDGRWAAYEVGAIYPRKLKGHTGTVYALAIGLDGRVYSGSYDKTMHHGLVG